MNSDPRARLRDNPFWVLGLPPDATRADCERAAQRVLAELALGREAARFYATALGPVERTPERVRAAVAELRVPARRLFHEAWAQCPVTSAPAPANAVPSSVCARLLGLRAK